MVKPEAVKCKHCGSDIGQELAKINNFKFSVRNVNHTTLFTKSGDSFLVNDEATRELAEEIKKHSKATRPSYIFGEHQEDLNYVKYLLPSAIQGAFINRIKYWLEK